MLTAATAGSRAGKTAKILIHRDEETALPKLFYSKLPPDIANLNVVLCDPMVRTCCPTHLP
eukprot:COSAG02_NODE_58544_length_277_cov_0.578652_1_plen_60_part_01